MKRIVALAMVLLILAPVFAADNANADNGRGEFWYVPQTVQHPESATSFNNIPVYTDIPEIIGEKTFKGINVATGTTVTKEELLKEDVIIDITDYGAEAGFEADAVKNTEAINKAMAALSAAGGGTVLVPDGLFKMYTIELQSNVNIMLSDHAIILGARPGIDGGNYLEPEVNIFFGLQDHGHSYMQNSMIYAKDAENVMIYGEGLITGSYIDKRDLTYLTVSKIDSADPVLRTDPGYNGQWNPPDDLDMLEDQGYRTEDIKFKTANKSIALVDCRNIVLSGFDMREVGHFAIITEGCDNVLIENMVIDTNRDGIDIDGTRNVTIRNSWVNAPTDDAICLKASFSTGRLDPTENILVYNCVVSGYDAGSVLEGTFLENRIESDWNVNGRVKLGTEGTCGFDRVTIANIVFARSEGITFQTVDCSNLTNIIATDLRMQDIMDAPVYIQVGDRSRYPVTGNTTDETVKPAEGIRIDNPEFVLPNIPEKYPTFPVFRYAPSVNKTSITLDDGSYFSYPDPENPIALNPQNYYTDPDTGKNYAYRWDTTHMTYVVDRGHELSDQDLYAYGNAIGGGYATLADVYIGNVEAVDVNPRFPIIIAGHTGSKVRNVTLENFDITYRGGLTLEDAVEQRQITMTYKLSEGHIPEYTRTVSWLANSSGNLPRVEWDAATGNWIPSPYNVPENVRDYPEPSHYSILPAYGLWTRHVDGLNLSNIKLGFDSEDTRPAVVLDDVASVTIDDDCEFMTAEGIPDVVLVQNNYKRRAGFEFVPNEPYFTTTVTDAVIPSDMDVENAVVNAPEPGTPNDSLYRYPTNAIADEKYMADYVANTRELPRTVWRPFFNPITDKTASAGDTVGFTVSTINPANQAEEGKTYPVEITASGLPEGAVFENGVFSWTVPSDASGDYQVVFTLDDGMNVASKAVTISVQ